MSKLMSVLGVILLAIGLVLGLLELMQPGRIQGLGVNLGNALDLIIGGVLALGLGGVIEALRHGVVAQNAMDEPTAATSDEIHVPGSSIGKEQVEVAPAPEAVADAAPAAEQPATSRFRLGFGKKLGAATAATAAGVAATTEAVADTSKSSVQDTLDALEQAKQDIKGALGGVESITEPAPEPPTEPADESVSEDELYVVEEKMIRGRPARILSDDTVEAETDEGWMRFENLEHLNEYLDAAGQ